MDFIFAENILHLIWNIVTEEKKKEEVKPVHERSKQSNSKKSKCLGQVNMSYHHWEYLIHSLRHPLLQIPPPLPCLSVRWTVWKFSKTLETCSVNIKCSDRDFEAAILVYVFYASFYSKTYVKILSQIFWLHPSLHSDR